MKHPSSTGTRILGITWMTATLLTGCAWSIGGREGEKSTVPPTQGQELIDLKRAHDQGALSDEEYEAQRQKVLTR